MKSVLSNFVSVRPDTTKKDMLNNPMFREYGDSIEFESLIDLNNKLTLLDLTINGTNVTDRERYTIVKYLLVLGNHNFLSYPLKVENIDLGLGESLPDFKINCKCYEYYLEVTIATTTQYMDEKDKKKIGKLYEDIVLIDGEEIEVKSLEVKNKDEVKDGEVSGITGNPILGDQSEVIFGKVVSKSILKKTEEKLPHYKIDKSKDIELLLYYIFPHQAGLDWCKSINYSNDNLREYNYDDKEKFDRIHLMNDSRFLYNILRLDGIDISQYDLILIDDDSKKDNTFKKDDFMSSREN